MIKSLPRVIPVIYYHFLYNSWWPNNAHGAFTKQFRHVLSLGISTISPVSYNVMSMGDPLHNLTELQVYMQPNGTLNNPAAHH